MGGGHHVRIARALGAGRRDDADALARHALAIGLGFGVVFTVAVLAGGRWLYGAMGGRGPSLAAASRIPRDFSAAILIGPSTRSPPSSRHRQHGGPRDRHLGRRGCPDPLSPCLIFGLALPRLGVAGGAIAVVAYYFLAASRSPSTCGARAAWSPLAPRAPVPVAALPRILKWAWSPRSSPSPPT